MNIGIQGEVGSACDEAAALLFPNSSNSFVYLTNAENCLAALDSTRIEAAVLALESPVGVPVPESDEALSAHARLKIQRELCREVRHCLMIHPLARVGDIRKVASHPIPLEKHRRFLSARFPNYQPIVLSDPGLAARKLAEGELCEDTAVIAMPRASEIFGLKIIETELPANDNYLTRFVVVERREEDL